MEIKDYEFTDLWLNLQMRQTFLISETLKQRNIMKHAWPQPVLFVIGLGKMVAGFIIESEQFKKHERTNSKIYLVAVCPWHKGKRTRIVV